MGGKNKKLYLPNQKKALLISTGLFL